MITKKISVISALLKVIHKTHGFYFIKVKRNQMTSTSISKRRILGSWENTLINISRKYQGLFRVAEILRLQGPIIRLQALEAAVSCLQQRHPFLRSRLRNNPATQNSYLMEEDITVHLKVREIHRKRNDHLNFWQQEWREREKDIPMIDQGLAEFWLLQDPDDYDDDEAPREIVIACEHSISDGISLSTVAHELLLALGEQDKTLFEHSLDWPVAMEVAIERSLSKWNRFITLSKFIVNATYQHVTNTKKIARIRYTDVDFPLHNAHEYCHTETFYHSLSKEDTKALFDRCHREGVTVTSAISIAIFCAVSTLVNNKDGYLTYAIAADNRRRYIPAMPNNFLSCQISGISLFSWAISDIPTINENMWQLARTFGDHVKTSINAGEIVASGMILGNVYMKDEGPLSVTNLPTCGIANWGPLPFQIDYGKWKLVEMIPSGNFARSFTPIALVHTINGMLTIAHVGPVPAYSSNDLEQLQNDTIKYLRQMIVN